LRGNPSKRSFRLGVQPAWPPEIPEPPDFLGTGEARQEWLRLAPQLHALGLLTAVDVPMLAVYCTSYERWRTALSLLNQLEANDPVMKGLLIKSRDRGAVRNPLLAVVRHEADTMRLLAAEFGFTPSARSRIHAVDPVGPSKFEGLIALNGPRRA
jgi:P27 family predicted phage terminase small subunit